MSRINELYSLRAKYASYESDAAELKLYTSTNSVLWKIADYLESTAKRWRLEVQEEIDEQS